MVFVCPSIHAIDFGSWDVYNLSFNDAEINLVFEYHVDAQYFVLLFVSEVAIFILYLRISQTSM